ncbi:hypothetical protein BBJ29_000879 [Phytophthora kernoviae]|uniref:Uncharacterized protein n=1 Tax=Phytophthora kernoviae TaxID=325452 RepID=A0A3F2S3K9_9STRA|nr:hypothetical protein BBJ29_000879 [Phytophthora kernoviae]RLN68859.1 hypothetical protein BBP00_00000760 [Phytophthora kernoviae]
MEGDQSRLREYVTASRTLLNAAQDKGEVPDEIQRVQELVECLDNNALKIATALAANRRRGADTGADTTAQLLMEQKQYITKIMKLFEQLSNKPSVASQVAQS